MTKTNYLLIVLLFCIYACKDSQPNKDTSTTPPLTTSDQSSQQKIVVKPDTIPTPTGYAVLAKALGNLNQDPLDEKVIVYDTNRETEFGKERELQIFRLVDDQWAMWHKSTSAILASQAGGVFGDPFAALSIERKCIVLEHFGGSRQKWKYTHRFRHQNDNWQLIGATVNFGAPCDSWEDFDYNLSNGKINYQKKTEQCEQDEVKKSTIEKTINIVQKLKELPEIDTFTPGENPINLFENGDKFYY